MTPVFFPFTHITNSQRDALLSCFKQIIVYKASSRAEHDSINQASHDDAIETRVPVKEGDALLHGALKEYLSLGHRHARNDLSCLKTQKNPTPFFDTDSTAAIRGNILAGTQPPDPEKIKAKARKDQLFKARLFLCMAQSFDRHHEETNRELELFAQKEIDFPGMDSNNRPEANIGVAGNLRLDTDYSDYMIIQRLRAFAGLLQEDGQTPGLFITTSTELLSYMMEKAPMMEKVMERLMDLPEPGHEAIRDMEQQLKGLSEAHWPENSGQQIDKTENNQIDALESIINETKKIDRLKLTFYMAPNQSPHQFFSRFSDVSPWDREENGEKKQTGRRIKNTLIGLMEASP